MDFHLDDELGILQQTARRFAEEEIMPVAAEHDRKAEFPRSVIKKAWDLGFVSTCVPEEFGGVGLSVQGSRSNGW